MLIKTGILIILAGLLAIAIVTALIGLLIGEGPLGSPHTLPAAEVHEHQGERALISDGLPGEFNTWTPAY